MKRILLAALLMLGAGAAHADDAVSFRLNWLIYGFHTPFYLGVEKGFYKQNGIDLTIGEGQGSGRAVQTVAAGSDTFGLADGSSIGTTFAMKYGRSCVNSTTRKRFSPWPMMLCEPSGAVR